LSPNGILPGANANLAFCYVGSVAAQHSSSGRQPNFAALSRGRPYIRQGGRLSHWASAHILVVIIFHFIFVLCH